MGDGSPGRWVHGFGPPSVAACRRAQLPRASLYAVGGQSTRERFDKNQRTRELAVFGRISECGMASLTSCFGRKFCAETVGQNSRRSRSTASGACGCIVGGQSACPRHGQKIGWADWASVIANEAWWWWWLQLPSWRHTLRNSISSSSSREG